MVHLPCFHFLKQNIFICNSWIWLAKCCKIQQLIIFIQQKYLFNFNKYIYSISTKIFIQLQPKIISFNNKVPDIQNIVIQQNSPSLPGKIQNSIESRKQQIKNPVKYTKSERRSNYLSPPPPPPRDELLFSLLKDSLP